MEITIEQKERRKNSQKEWKEKNPDYFKNYYIVHKEHMLENAEKWRQEKDLISTVYWFKNSENENIYIGSTTHKARFSSHLTGNSHLNLDAETLVSEYDLDKIVYKDFSEYNLNRYDLYFLEKYYKEIEKSILDGKAVPFREDQLSKSKEELIDIANSTSLRIFDKLDRYLN
jgi:hypothetical protein